MIRRTATAAPMPIPALVPVERPEFVGDTCLSNVPVLVASVSGSCVEVVVIGSLADGRNGASDGFSVCEVVLLVIVSVTLMVLPVFVAVVYRVG
jgi:hypothetical protein